MALGAIIETSDLVALNRRDRAVLRFLAEKQNKKSGGSFWAQAKIGAQVGWGERSIRSALASLEEAGWIERTRQHNRAGGRSTDFIHVRTKAEAAAWIAARLEAGELDHVAPPFEDQAAPETRQRVNKPTREPAFASRRIDPVMHPDNQAEETVPLDAIQLDLARRFQAHGHEPPAEWADDADPANGRKVTG